MATHKNIHEKGKFSLAKFFQKFKVGDSVALVKNLGFKLGYSKRLQGRTGKVLAKRGAAYYVEIKDLNKPKRYSIKPIHLQRIEAAK
jgi:large subunit ribosomal protein L21e